MKKLLITGASGFIGGFLVEHAIDKGYEVWAGIRQTSSKKYLTDSRIHFIEIDFENLEDFENKLKDHRFNYIIHNAGLTKTKKASTYNRVNSTYLENFVSILRKENIEPEKFVFISSLAAKGPADGLPGGRVDNLSAAKPVTNYGKSKRLGEEFLESLHGDFPFIIIRPVVVYGPREKDLFTVFELVKKGLELYVGSKEQKLNFIFVQDLVRLIILSLEKGKLYTAYFGADETTYTNHQLNGLIKNSLDKKTFSLKIPIPILKVAASLLETIGGWFGNYPPLNRDKINELECTNWTVSAPNLKTDLNFTPEYSLDQGIKITTDWYLKNGWL